MELVFADTQFERYAVDSKYAQRKLGLPRARLLGKRLDALKIAQNLEELRFVSGRFHELIGNRKGQWSCDLDYPYRLIFNPSCSPIPTLPNGSYDWTLITAVQILEIVDYH